MYQLLPWRWALFNFLRIHPSRRRACTHVKVSTQRLEYTFGAQLISLRNPSFCFWQLNPLKQWTSKDRKTLVALRVVRATTLSFSRAHLARPTGLPNLRRQPGHGSFSLLIPFFFFPIQVSRCQLGAVSMCVNFRHIDNATSPIQWC